MVFLYGLLALTNLFTSSSTHSAPAALPVTPPSTPQFTNIMPHITTTQRAWDEYYRQNPPAGRKEARIKPPAVSLRGIDKLQREIFGSAAKPMVFKPVIRPGNIDWPGLKIANDTPFRKQDIPIMPPPVWITPSDPK
jgi:hypothetical protein